MKSRVFRPAVFVVSLLCAGFVIACGSSSTAPTGPPPASGPVINTSALAQAVKGENYNQPVTAQGGATPYSWSEEGALPVGVSFDKSAGMFRGTPSEIGSYPLNVAVTDSKGMTSSKSLSLSVLAVPCRNEEFNDSVNGGIVHLKVMAKPCGLTLKVGTLPPVNSMQIELRQDVVDTGWFVFGISQDPIDTPDDQIHPRGGDPWSFLATHSAGLARGVVGFSDFSQLLNQYITADQIPQVTYLLVTLQGGYGGLFWTSAFGCHSQPGTLCGLWQRKIVLNDQVQ